MRIKDLYSHLPEDISKTNKKTVAQFVAARLAEMGDLRFNYATQYQLSKRPRGRTSDYHGAMVYYFTCSQAARRRKPSTLPYAKTRNRRPRMQVMDCGRSLQVTTFSDDFDFDIAVDLDHPNDHQGREHFGVPQNVRRWIENNPRHSPLDQRKDLMAAIARGELSVSKKYLSPTNVFYWWRKMYKEKQYASQDPWENAFNILENHSGVMYLHPNYAEFTRQPTSYTGPNRVDISSGSCITQWKWIYRRSRRFTSMRPSTHLNRTRISTL